MESEIGYQLGMEKRIVGTALGVPAERKEPELDIDLGSTVRT